MSEVTLMSEVTPFDGKMWAEKSRESTKIQSQEKKIFARFRAFLHENKLSHAIKE